MTYKDAIEWLYSTQLFGIKLGLDGPRRLLREFLAYPDHGVQVIHVAGTNGKGSTCAMIDSIARACGRRSGLFTSPHLIDFSERIRVSGVEIPEEACAAMLTRLRDLCETFDPHPTFFEIALTLAMRWFREQACDLLVLETGMGGRLDATTAVPADVCVITPIGMDHMQWLGDTLAAIAAEKAGIMVPGKPTLSAPQEPEAAVVLEQHANQIRSPFEFIREPLRGYGIALAGEHQQWNAALAVAALHRAGLPLTTETVRHGLARVSWPGRFERIAPGVILDGAHNPHAACALASTWRSEQGEAAKASLVFSAVADKEIDGILEQLAPLASRIFLCPVDSPRALPPEEIARHLPQDSPPHACYVCLEDAFAAARQHPAPILIAGSLFLVGEARALLAGGRFQPSAQ